MRLAAGIVANHPVVVDAPDTTLLQFTISVDRLGDLELLDSSSSPPGRFAGEILHRLRRLEPHADVCLAMNPQLGLSVELIQRVMSRARWADPAAHGWWLLCDEDGRWPLAYALRADLAGETPPVHLSLLTASDVALDERLLRASFGPGLRMSIGPVHAGLSGVSNRFIGPVNPALHDLTRIALEVLEAAPSDAARRELVLHGERAAVVGFHAGDVLFVLQALAHERTTFRAVVVLQDYADIVSALCPDLDVLAVKLPVPQRGAYHIVDEAAVLRDYIWHVPRKGRFFHLVRPIYRDYKTTRHNMREVSAFALGGPGHRLRPSPPLSAASAREHALMRPLPGRVVLQFDTGWQLKNVPPDRRGEILDLLIDRGYQPVLLGDPEPARPDVPAVPYTGLGSFRALLGTAEALIGCDSFPAHFSEQVGVPTVILFGPTRTTNARARESARYRVLHHPMPCVPCDQITTCLLDQGHSCHAQATAGEVLAALEALLPARRGATPPRELAELEPLIEQLTPGNIFPGRPPLSAQDRERFLDAMLDGVTLERLERCPLCGGADLRYVGTRLHLPVAACQGCGLWLAQERLVERDLPLLYSERYWNEFQRLHGYSGAADRYIFDYIAALERVRDVAALAPPGASVLDIGCALAPFPRRLAEFGYRSAGLEMDSAVARQASLLSGVPVFLSREQIRASGERFDVVTMFDVFEHLYDPVGYVASLRPLMAPAGALLLETFRTDSAAFQREGLDHEDVKPIEHPFMYRQSHIEELLRRAGLDPVRVTYPMGELHARVRIAARWRGGA